MNERINVHKLKVKVKYFNQSYHNAFWPLLHSDYLHILTNGITENAPTYNRAGIFEWLYEAAHVYTIVH